MIKQKMLIMKLKITLTIILLSTIASAQTSKVSILNVVLNDSIVSNYISDYGGIQSDSYVLLEDSGYFFYNHGNIEFKKQSCEIAPSVSGIITKVKSRQTKASIKIYFNENETYYTKVKLERENINRPWQIRTRLIYRNFQLPRKQTRLIYFSHNS